MIRQPFGSETINITAPIPDDMKKSCLGKTIRVANMLPAVILAVIAAYIPWSF